MENYHIEDKLGEECGIFGGFATAGDIRFIIRNGLFKLQHRGQESAGISCGEDTQTLVKARGLVMQALTDDAIAKAPGRFGIGHVRYPSNVHITAVNAQPYLITYLEENVAIAMNGHVKKASKIREKFERIGEIFITSSNSEVILKRIVFGLRKPPSQWTFEEIGHHLGEDFSSGGYSLVLSLPQRIVAYRDPIGYRPLVMCEAEEGYFVASEDIAFTSLNVKKIVEIMPGEGVEITEHGYKIAKYCEPKKEEERKCVFEHIYFAHPASNIFDRNVYMTRVELGRRLAENETVTPDVVVPVVDSGLASAIGYSLKSGIPMQMGLLRNLWVGRSFIAPQTSRAHIAREKLIPNKAVVNGKKVVLIDDSLVRGTTAKEIVNMCRQVGAKEVHLRLASPMILNICSWGVSIPTTDELIAVQMETEERIAKEIGADSVRFLPLNKLKEIFGEKGWCYWCFNKKVQDKKDKV